MTLQINIKSKIYPSRTPGDHHQALSDINLSIPLSQFVCLVGPSGCGKTTLLNILSGLDKEINGEIKTGKHQEKDSMNIGYVFQDPRLMPWLSVINNIRLVMKEKEIISGSAEKLLADMKLGDVADAFPNRLSGGMQRRVALARAFVKKPKLLLMDEPFVSLDQPVADQLRQILLSLWNEHPATIFFVTHDIREAIFLSDRILFMSPSPGTIVKDFKNPLPRPRVKLNVTDIEDLKQRLLNEHPDLLTGLIKS